MARLRPVPHHSSTTQTTPAERESGVAQMGWVDVETLRVPEQIGGRPALGSDCVDGSDHGDLDLRFEGGDDLVELGVGAAVAVDFANGVHDGGMVAAAEVAADFLE